ncbi:hypothetical protein HBDW_26450 [Herbaspirillum sp. DW155]|uniref:hypothetical protein n=1 Tax=Herbaspirillum sp. DW155 TaxID=3095609 RepID=UPI00308868CD|nr:hypothetical protein HBDW_26450 [Herbaspirillum sp. DW155]
MGKIWIGISGWRYAPWRGSFYPKGLRQDDELHYARVPAVISTVSTVISIMI